MVSEDAPGTLIHVDHGSQKTWHHSVEFDGYTHVTACGQEFACDRFDELRMDIGDWADLDPSGCCDECAGSVRSLKPAIADGGTNDVVRYTASTDRPGVTYGPAFGTDGYVLAVTTEYGRVEIVFPEGPMYTLWTEVKDRPWPDRDRTGDRGRMIRQVVHAANGADEEMLRNALEALGVPEDER